MPKRKCHFKDEYTKTWSFIRKGQTEFEAMCSICNSHIAINHGGISDIKQHIATNLHKSNIRTASTSTDISSFMIRKDTNEEILIAAAELTTAYKVVRHHKSFNSLDCTTKLNALIFPKNAERCSLWLKACKFPLHRDNVLSSMHVCSRHFTDDSFKITRPGGRALLKQDAVPSIFDVRRELKRSVPGMLVLKENVNPNPNLLEKARFADCSVPDAEIVVKKESVVSTPNIKKNTATLNWAVPIAEMFVPRDFNGDESPSRDWRPNHVGSLVPEHFSTPRRARRHLNMTKDAIAQKAKQIKVLRQKNRRLIKQVTSLSCIIQQLKEKKLISNSTEDVLQKFALTLQFYSARAYTYVRRSFRNLLPHPRTVSRWYEVIGGRPGFTKESFGAIRRKASETEVVLNIVIDEMAIRKYVHWNGKQFSGFVDFGIDLDLDADENNIPRAKNALVFMAVSMTDSWKIPF
ncbi:hypothetical protein CBL_20114 [Carabus blaptoides fortunei]